MKQRRVTGQRASEADRKREREGGREGELLLSWHSCHLAEGEYGLWL